MTEDASDMTPLEGWEPRPSVYAPPARSPELGKLFAALAKAQGMMRGAVKDQKNPFYKSDYADLASVCEAVREPLTTNELAFYHELHPSDGSTVTVTCVLGHSSGQYITSTVTLKPAKADAQGIGGAQTYGRRYTLCAITGLPQIDDDGNAASGVSDRPPAKQLNDLAEDIAQQTGGREVDPNTRKPKKKTPAKKAPAKRDKGDIPGYTEAGVINKKQVDALWLKAEQMTGNQGQETAAPVVKCLLERHKLSKTADVPAALYDQIMEELANIDQPNG